MSSARSDDSSIPPADPAANDSAAAGPAAADLTLTQFDGPFPAAQPEAAGPWPVGARFGSIRVLRRLAVGGMGEVFEGFDESLRRRVALKALRQDRLSKAARARLLFEARVLSQLSDPRICGVYGWIEDPGGEFLVLELIEGYTLEGFFARQTPRATVLRLASDLAEVLTASHRKGVIHRDLKPSNLMLTRAGKLKVLDFGISSLAHLPEPKNDDEISALDLGNEGFDEEALRSRAGTIVGTIHYMSPEQARGERLTAASDMYSYGLVLEELLTGRKPHEEAGSVLEILIRLQKGERPHPQGLPPALTNLLLQLTAAAPEARPTAADVVDKLATIRDAPRRRLRQLAAAAAATLALAAGVWHTHRLTVERNLAREAEQRAVLAHRESEEMVTFLESMFAVADPHQVDSKKLTARDILERGAERVQQSFHDQPAVKARLLSTLGRVCLLLGMPERADAALSEALSLVENLTGAESSEVAQALAALAQVRREQDRHAEARELQLRALEISRRLDGAASESASERLLELGNTEVRLAKFEDAEAHLRESLAIRERLSPGQSGRLGPVIFGLANLMRNRGRYAEALDYYQRGLALENPSEPLWIRGNNRYNTGITLSQLGRYDEAEKSLDEALAMWTVVYGEGSGDVAKIELALATLDRKKLRFDAAEVRYLRVLETWRKINGPESTNVAFGLNNLGNLYLEQSDLGRSEERYRQSLAIFEKRLGPDHPHVAMAMANLGRCLVGQKRYDEAVPLLRRVAAIDERSSGPTSADYGWDLLTLAQALWHQNRAEARDQAQRGRAILEKQVGSDHPDLLELLKENPALFGSSKS